MPSLTATIYTLLIAAIFIKLFNYIFKKAINRSIFKTAPKLSSANDENLRKEIDEITTKCVGHIDSNSTYQQQSEAMSKLLQSNVFKVPDELLISNTLKLFIAHRVVGAKYEGGISTRITVQVSIYIFIFRYAQIDHIQIYMIVYIV